MIDIHTHILPAVDDGAESLSEAYEMVLMAVRCGVKGIAATPHGNLEGDFAEYELQRQEQVFQQLKQLLLKEQVPIQLYRGMEVFPSVDIVDKLQAGKLLTMNQTPYVLIEFHEDEELWWIEGMMEELQDSGYRPVIAHPERCFCVQEDPHCVYEWKTQGIHTQMNKGSLLGRFGQRVERTAKTLLRQHLYTCVASDAHHADVRTTDMKELCYTLQRYCSMEEQERLLHRNPKAILQGLRILEY